MSFTQEQIENIIKNLSKLQNSNPKIQGDVKKIIGHMEILNEVDTTGVKPTVSVSDFVSPLREDEEKRFTKPQETLKCSKQNIIGGQIAISNIMK